MVCAPAMKWLSIQAQLEFEVRVYSPQPRLHGTQDPDPGLNLDHNPRVGGGGLSPESDQEIRMCLHGWMDIWISWSWLKIPGGPDMLALLYCIYTI